MLQQKTPRGNLDVGWTDSTSHLGHMLHPHQTKTQPKLSTVHSRIATEHVLEIAQRKGVYNTTLTLGKEFKSTLRILLAHLARQDPRYWLTST